MSLNTSKCNHLKPVHFKGLVVAIHYLQCYSAYMWTDIVMHEL